MTTLSRKQREIREREERILEVALEMLSDQGYHGLNMDRIAERLEYSKGTIYQHFPNKEEIILALTNRAAGIHFEFFRRAASFRGRSRQRIHAIGLASELFVRMYPHYSSLEQVIRLSSVLEKTSENRQKTQRLYEAQCHGVIAGIVRDAIACGDLTVPGAVTPESILFGLWAITFGGVALFNSTETMSDMGLHEPWQALRQNQMTLIDGYGWQPLTVDYPFAETQQRLETEVFGPEFQQLAAP